MEHDVDGLGGLNKLVASGLEKSGLTLPSPPSHPMVSLTPATRLVGIVVKWRLVVEADCATAAAINVAQTKRVFEICILRAGTEYRWVLIVLEVVN